MANEKRLDLIDRAKVYQLACAGCTRHGESLGECCHDEPCERLVFAFTVAAPVDAVEVVRCYDCKHFGTDGCAMDRYSFDVVEEGFCSYGERRS